MNIYFQSEGRRKGVGSRRKPSEANIAAVGSTSEGVGRRRKHGFPPFASDAPHQICRKGKGDISRKGYTPSPPAKCAGIFR